MTDHITDTAPDAAAPDDGLQGGAHLVRVLCKQLQRVPLFGSLRVRARQLLFSLLPLRLPVAPEVHDDPREDEAAHADDAGPEDRVDDLFRHEAPHRARR